LEAKPTSVANVDINIQGAFVTCWVNHDNLREARQKAIQYVEEAGWEVISEQGFDEIFPEFLERHTESYTIYQAALRDGYVLEFYPWLDKKTSEADHSETS
jgi:hypothetical protein